jgi:hypothetical protein
MSAAGPAAVARLGAALLSLTALLIGAGCPPAPPAVSLAPAARRYTARDYDGLRDRWTRSGRIIKQLDTSLHVHATFLSHELGVAQAAKLAALFHLSREEQAKLERGFEERARTSHAFFLGTATADYRWNDFERKDSVWQLRLVGGEGEQVAPIEIKAERDVSATVTELYPYVEDFYRVYTVRFPLLLPDGRPLVRSGTEELTLVLAGALGKAELVWRLR